MNKPLHPALFTFTVLPAITAAVVAVFLTMEDESDLARYAAVLSLSYIVGSVPWGYMLLQWRRGVDIRDYGSGSIGMTNVLRTGGGKFAAAVLLLDFGKGVLAVLLARQIIDSTAGEVTAGLAVLVGHNWPVFLVFKGGRGVAPTMGVLLALGRLEIAAFMVIGTAGWRLTGGSPFWILLGLMLLPFFSLFWGRPLSIVLLMVGILGVTVLKRLMSNSLRGTGVGFARLMLNRLIYDRDIADHDAWVARGDAAAGE